MYGQMTAGSWIYIGTQGILQGTYETFGAVARRALRRDAEAGRFGAHRRDGRDGRRAAARGDDERGRVPRRRGRSARIEKRVETALLRPHDATTSTRRSRVLARSERGEGVRSGSSATAPRCSRSSCAAASRPTSDRPDLAHDALVGYVPPASRSRRRAELRAGRPAEYIAKRRWRSMRAHVQAMVAHAASAARSPSTTATTSAARRRRPASRDAFDFPGFVPAYIRPLFCEGKGPFRWVALSGDPEDIDRTDELVLELFPDDEHLRRWITMAREQVEFQGLPARICWLGQGERATLRRRAQRPRGDAAS